MKPIFAGDTIKLQQVVVKGLTILTFVCDHLKMAMITYLTTYVAYP